MKELMTRYTVRPHPQWKTEISLSLSKEAKDTLLSVFTEVLESGKEKGISLPQDPKSLETYTIYWKIQNAESRVLIAHPDSKSWVATIALSLDHFQSMTNEVQKLSEKSDEVKLSDSGPLHFLSNLHITFEYDPNG